MEEGVRALAPVVGGDLEVPLVSGPARRYANLDYAASAPALQSVWEAVQRFLPWYSSVHRGSGLPSQVSTQAYEAAREAVRGWLGARDFDAVVFTRNTTDAVNLLATCLPAGWTVVTTGQEHHANLLPWRRKAVVELPVPPSSAALLESVEAALRRLAGRGPTLLAVTGASNVTGEVWPVGTLADLVHGFGGRIFVDAAQLAPHRAISLQDSDLDWLAFSGHKLYAPFGSGALVGRSDWLLDAEPYLPGGGTVLEVGLQSVIWAALPDRHEGGSPNVIGAVALGAACEALQAIGLDAVTRHDRELGALLLDTLDRLEGVERYAGWSGACDRVGLATFNVAGRDPAQVAAILSAEYGIGVRAGSFCAHPLMVHLVAGGTWSPGCGMTVPGALRASLGVGSCEADVRRLGEALDEIGRVGPRWTYRKSRRGGWEADPDPRLDPPATAGRPQVAAGAGR